MNGPVPTMDLPFPPCPRAYGLLLRVGLSPSFTWIDVGLRMPKAGPVWLSRKLLCGARSLKTTVVGSGASTESTLDASPKPPNAAA